MIFLLRLTRRLIGLGIVAFALTATMVVILQIQEESRAEPPGPFAAALVLGGGLVGSELSPNSRTRVETGIRLWREGRAPILVFSGGPWRREGRVVGHAMADYAIARGVPRAAVRVEEAAVSTFENIRLSKALLPPGPVALVTEAFHMPRSRALAQFFGVEVVPISAGTALSDYRLQGQIWLVTREALAWWFNLFKIVAWTALEGAPVARGTLIR